MRVGQEENNRSATKAWVGTLMALRASFWLPVVIAAVFSLIDIYHVYMQYRVTGYVEMKAEQIFSLYGMALLRAVNNYFPTALLPFAAVAIAQRLFYGVSSGFALWRLDSLALWTLVYTVFYAVHVAYGSEDPLLSMVLMAVTGAFGFGIWLSLDEEVRRAPSAWRRIATG